MSLCWQNDSSWHHLNPLSVLQQHNRQSQATVDDTVHQHRSRVVQNIIYYTVLARPPQPRPPVSLSLSVFSTWSCVTLRSACVHNVQAMDTKMNLVSSKQPGKSIPAAALDMCDLLQFFTVLLQHIFKNKSRNFKTLHTIRAITHSTPCCQRNTHFAWGLSVCTSHTFMFDCINTRIWQFSKPYTPVNMQVFLTSSILVVSEWTQPLHFYGAQAW